MEFPNCLYLPNEIIINILHRLPSKSIGRCRCVSKTWNSLVSTPQFIKTHLTHIRKHPQQSLFLIKFPPFWKSLSFTNAHHLFDEITASARTLNFDAYSYNWTEIICSCDGLMLVGGENHVTFVVNPTTLEISEVPVSPFAFDPCTSYTMFGLGYHSVDDDYKIVALSYYYDIVTEFIPDYIDMIVHIYSVKNGKWKMCGSSPYDLGLGVDHLTSGVFVEGCIHWLARRTTDYSIVILAFDVEEEAFFEVPTHSSIDQDMIWFHYIEVLGGCLCICINHTDVWIMKEYGVHDSWTKYVILDPEGAGFRPMCLLGQEKLVLKKCERPTMHGKLVTYNLEENSFKDVVVHGFTDNDFTVWETYIETLVSPHRSNELGRDC